jgi:membrane protease YdiL (CAAX protease family)
MKTLDALDLRSLVRTADLKPTAIIISAALLCSVHRYFGSIESAPRIFGPVTGLSASTFMFASAFVLLGVIPFALITWAFHERARDYGLKIGNARLGGTLTAILLPVITLALLYPASHTAEMRSFYPFAPEARVSLQNFLILEVSRGLFFYTAWEFFFRGFMLFGLRPYVGDWMAVLIQVIPQCLWHIGMPTGEIMSSIAGGILFGVIALRTRSILWPLLLHYGIGVGLDVLIVIQQ